MNLVKKLVLAPVFLIVFALLIYQLVPFFKSYDVIFSLSLSSLIQLIILAALILIASLLFNLFAALSQDWKLVLPVGVAAALIALLLVGQPLGLVLAAGTLITTLLSYLTVESRLKSYLTFEPNSLLGPAIRHLAGLLVLTISLTYFLSVSKPVQQHGFQIPDSIIDTALKFAGPQPSLIPPDSIKQTVKDQLQNLLKPYLGFIPMALAVILFLTLQSIVSILGLLIYPLLWLVFYMLEKTNFISFTTEMREIKKMVV